MWNTEPELYREKYYARKGTGNTTQRKSLRTNRLDVATRRLRDLINSQDRNPILIGEIYAAYRKDKHDPYQKLEYMWRCLSPFFENLRPDQVTRELCREYKEMRQKSNGTVLRELSTLRAALRWHDPATRAGFDMPPPSPPKHDYLTRGEVEQLLNACREPHIILYIVLSIATAARKSALLELTWDQVDFERGLIDLGVSNGNKRRAVVPMNSSAEELLEKAYQSRLTNHVIEFNGQPIKDIKTGFKTAVRRSGLKRKINPHMLRHTSAVWMAENEIPMSQISQYLGHSNTEITERVYARYSPQFLKKAASSLEIGFNCTQNEKMKIG